MIEIPNHLHAAIEDPTRFHYKQEWLESTEPGTENIFELFSFGTIKDIQPQLNLTPAMFKKLQLLTIVSMVQTQRELSYTYIMEQCKIFSTDIVERYLIELRLFFKVKLDSIRQAAQILSIYDCRDVYDNEKPLQYVCIPRDNKDQIIEKLKQWHGKLTGQIKDPN
ncbi:similar to Saccharomyces cerevisiae YDR179C CSN9 Subunit of the Cop9 signalosome, which is required for deneddylation, or removal of the ubiquitin- like protein Rub1p from Cdc53p (cullin) [Maudiozyma barnettii]|uniref:Similar to Saccharomyces cerevisiae YDR179C CSN9 Subunit of the Cop9 signalosome, which is required for deneddylation, or removal of the ubiquitin- like protein Rub1p from Cdc53p (Cullin) n=1 Tax=Maudiozyma barnettii TaxID=61262 RepID=A0A8H2VE62_9SACH|nr:Csn9p [Kazachstania barnettii]CAB4253939.1 similar to Saccharomyces cerevisiae YDR179C CSN9 Subunit of the Cop9 signalosome, which is required for deneddylation, or removal of the ubiquitin- like protein Rub1p from Cdc53p (cullin) [Kazachstania barnettii]CAD1781689.1 similar to Saccharomyces cerevisiae YDR179C CSN9 Subunit of the Cop9 signalosome, which is required for deneddylation, or removal of the ubiquitin- like protein Rub1p from Cdc53p (cullin) [Kazachstania barnettii]